MFKRLQNSASVWTEKDLSRLLLQARNAYEKDEFATCNRMLDVLLAADPGNPEARALKNSICSTSPAVLSWPEEDAEFSFASPELKASPAPDPIPATPVVPAADSANPRSGFWKPLKVAVILVLVLTLAVTAVLVIYSQPREAAPDRAENIRSPRPAPVAKAPTLIDRIIPRPLSLSPEVQAQVMPSAPIPVVAPPPKPRSEAKPKAAAPVTAKGVLSVSSRLAADIYVDGEFVASTPATIELPAGVQTVEYRHGDLSKTVQHVITGGETTAAMVNFEVTVQINAKPWAHVFVEGAERLALGQTPLSEIRVPVGATLVFENPNFTKKNYRVTGKETAIQVVFP